MGKTAFIFAGQGAQIPGMGKNLYDNSPAAKKIFDMAGDGIKHLTFEASAEVLNLTINAQPCIFATDLACAEALRERNIVPDGVAGFSLGEVPAIVFSGMMDLKQGFEFVNQRARSMHNSATENPGGMVAILRLSAAEVENICSKLEGCWPANYNCEGQTVVAYSKTSLAQLQQDVKSAGGRAVSLAVSGAFHSPLMKSAAEEIAKYLQDVKFGEAEIPVYSNVTGKIHRDAPQTLLAKHVISPVLWQQTVENMVLDGFDTFIEVGPGKTLSGLIAKINKDVRIFNVSDMNDLEHAASNI